MGKKGKGKAAAVPEVAAGPGISLFGGSKLLTGGEAEALSRTGGEVSSSEDEEDEEDEEVSRKGGTKRRLPDADAADEEDDEDEDEDDDDDDDDSSSDDDSVKEAEVSKAVAKEGGKDDEEKVPPLPTTFQALGLGGWLAKQCGAVGMPAPTEVQANCIPQVLAGKDVCGYAKTGSGKTAAFALPVVQTLSEDPFGVCCVVLTPSRELAFQIAEQFHVLGKPIRLREVVIVGGMDMVKQGLELTRRPHVVIATPGRLADHLANCATEGFGRVKYLVLDEADRLLGNSSFRPDLETILDALPASRQTMLFSATEIEDSCPIVDALHKPVFSFKAKSDTATVKELRQEYVLMPSHVRYCYFFNVISKLPVGQSAIIFTSTCRSCEELALTLKELDFPCVSLHSQMSQNNRLASLGKFRSGFIKYLVATDVASRGLDIAPVRTVINFNTPKAVNDYIHRVGRTARAGRGGKAITMVSERDVSLLQAIEEKIGMKMPAYEALPTEDEVLKMLSKVNSARRAANLQLTEMEFGERKKKRAHLQKLREAAAGGSSGGGGRSMQPKKKKLKRKEKGGKAAAAGGN